MLSSLSPAWKAWLNSLILLRFRICYYDETRQFKEKIMQVLFICQYLCHKSGKYGRKDVQEKIQVSFSLDKKEQQSQFQERQSDFQKIQTGSNNQYEFFWGNDDEKIKNQTFLQGGRVSNAPTNPKDEIQHVPKQSQRGDLFHGEPNTQMYRLKEDQEKQNNQNMTSVLQNLLRNNDFSSQSLKSQTQQQNQMQQQSSQKPAQLTIQQQKQQLMQQQMFQQQQQQQFQQSQPIQRSINYPNNQNLIVSQIQPGSNSSYGWDERSQVFNTKSMDPTLKQIFQKAGIKRHEAENQKFAPMINAIIKEAETKGELSVMHNTSRPPLNAPIQSSQQNVGGSMNTSMAANKSGMPKNSILLQVSNHNPHSQNVDVASPLPAQNQQGDMMEQIRQGVQLNHPVQQQGLVTIPKKEEQSLTQVLAQAIEERRKQMHINNYDTPEQTSWEDDDY